MQHTLPKKVRIHDITIRDGFQREEIFIPTEAKMYLLNNLVDAGFKHIEVSNFAHPKYLPQFKDVDEIVKRLPPRDDVEYTFVTMGSDMAVDRAIAAKEAGYKVDRILVGMSTSEKHNYTNTGKTHAEALPFVERSIEKAHKAGIKINATVMTIFGCPFEGKMPIEKAWDLTDLFLKMGADDIEHADHDGHATPSEAYRYFSEVLDRHPDTDKHIFHIHDSRGMGLAAYYAALQAGIDQFETTLGGLGGQPANFIDRIPLRGTGEYYNPARRPGLVSTEDFLVMLDGMGIETGLDVDKVLGLGRTVEKVCGRNLWSMSITAGKLE